MKTKLIRMSVITVVAAAAVYAQNAEGMRMKTTIPFDFVVGHQKLPAGQYTVEHAVALPVLILRSAAAQAQIITQRVESVSAATRGELVFHTYGKEQFLSEVWTPGSASGRQLHMTSYERELAAGRAVGTTTIAAGPRR